jgi:hypothetical protein
MDATPEKAKQWIDEGKDPRSAYWQAGLESVMDVFKPYLEAGKLTPIQPLEEADIAVFQEALAVVDLSPNLLAAFMPPAVADKIRPPESAEEIQRIDKDQPSYKIIVIRPGEDPRLLSAEFSAQARKPGLDIFQAGALLGTYDFTDRSEFLSTLKKILRTHIWEKTKWQTEDYKRYTVSWFERVMDLYQGDISVEADFSFFHRPHLIKSNRIDAIFTLIFETFKKRADHPDAVFEERVSAIRAMTDADSRMAQFKELGEKTVFQMLTIMKDCELVDFKSFSDKENKQFNREFDRTVQRIVKKLAPA